MSRRKKDPSGLDSLKTAGQSSQESEESREELEGQLVMSGITLIISGTLFLYFLRAVFYSDFLVNFSVDAIVGTLALIFLVRSLRTKYRLLKHSALRSYSIQMDVASFILAALLRLFWQIPFDFSLPILTISYFFQRRRWSREGI
ncbi:MAG: hypothetical protein SPI19_00110 [Peptoniphilaceae bacterium]|nr:hypothetical protein [Peptoniphilaceae bacterium]